VVNALVVIIITILGKIILSARTTQPLHFADHRTAVTLARHSARQRPSAPAVDTTKSPGNVVNTWEGGLDIATNTADPSFVELNGLYYAFATNKYVIPRDGQVNI